ncbi:MAG: sialate O-acetylesterase [Limnochordia bacterium]|jgi:sialate O-acetylesterase
MLNTAQTGKAAQEGGFLVQEIIFLGRNTLCRDIEGCVVMAGDSILSTAPIFSDGMVLQRGVPLRLWGKASPQEELQASFRGGVFSFQSDAEGSWQLDLPPQEPGGPFELTITGQNGQKVIRDILIGDVWLLAGQSNMELPVARTLDLYTEEVQGAENPMIRQFRVPITHNFQGPQTDLPKGTWQAVTPESVLEFSALGYFFAQVHYARYQVPVGLVLTAVGGSRIETWLSEEVISGLGGYEDIVAKLKQPGYLDAIMHGELREYVAWQKELDAKDQGLQPGQIPWNSPELDDSEWDTMVVPKIWKGTELENFHGSVWLRREVERGEGAGEREALLRLGAIVDADETYINGVRVGKTEYKYPPRKYQVPPGVLRPGTNTIAIRVIINRDTGGFVERKRYVLEMGSEQVDLSGEWKYKVGGTMELLPRLTRAHRKPSGMYNAMIAPLRGCAFRGVLWYQGESNAHAPEQYHNLLKTLIAHWREEFGCPDLPFLYVQLPNFDTSSEGLVPGCWALLREAQLEALEVPNTAMAVTIDIGEANDLHPQNKKDIALRLSLAARRLIFREDVVDQGPLFKRLERENGALLLYFTNIGSGLRAQGGELTWFEVCGADGIFHPAKAQIEGETIRVWSAEVPEPQGVRYAWHDNPEGANLYNEEGLPASPFRASL